MPTRASRVPTRADSWTPVRIVNRLVLPTMGRPTIAVFIFLFGGPSRVARPPGSGFRPGFFRRLPRTAGRCAMRVLTTTRCANTGTDESLHVVGRDVVAAFDRGQRLRRAIQRLRAARAHAHRQRFVGARSFDDGEHVVDQRFVHGDLRDGILQRDQFFAGNHRTRRDPCRRAPDWRRISRSAVGVRDSRCGCASGNGRAAIRAAGRCRDAPPDSASRSP